jgi:glycine cleavage system H lipoate-binding protein/ABC-type phosphate transport system substrate-binding protein
MKTFVSTFILLSCFLFSFYGNANGNSADEQATSENAQTVQIYTTPELAELTNQWTLAFGKSNPNVKVEVIETNSESDFSDGELRFTTRDAENEPAWKMVVGHDIVVPVFNAQNLFFGKLNEKGLTSNDFAGIISEETNWADLIQDGNNAAIRTLISDNEQVISKLAGFTRLSPEQIKSQNTVPVSELVSAIQNDVNAIGFCKLTDVLNAEENSFAGQIAILPIDKNENGKIDGFENIFTNPQELTRGAWIGKYPRELCGDVFALTTEKPDNEAVIAFLGWVLNEGQTEVGTLGFSNLSSREKASGILALTEPVAAPAPVSTSPGFPWGRALSLTALAVILVAAVVFFKRKQKAGILSEDIAITPALNVNSVDAPAGLYYDKTHTWAFMEKDGRVKIGIDDFLQHITGPLTQVKLKTAGEKVRKGEKIFTITREGKQLEICSPVSGYIRQYNDELLSNPEKLNSSPYAEGWVYQIEPANWLRETRFMFMADKFKEWLDDEFIRLKDFLATSANSNAVVYNHIVLQDGGELTDNVLADLGPEVWEDFQTHFLDTSK